MKLFRYHNRNKSNALSGAVFLMATSAIGPGFLTQTTVFTEQLMASMGFVILCSIVIDIIVQLNIWQILTAQHQRASHLCNRVIPGSGHLLTLLICFGGLAFNIGNISGAGLGLNMLLPISVRSGSIFSALLAVLLFAMPQAMIIVDRFVKLLGLLMLVMVLLVVVYARPPLTEAALRAVWPEKINWEAVVTLMGGTVGGYISFAGAHRLLEESNVPTLTPKLVRRQAVKGILLTALMRSLLFLAVLGVLYHGGQLSAQNPAGSVFQQVLGTTGHYLFGAILWSAAITSVVGVTYTSVSFLQTLHPIVQKQSKWVTLLFIITSTVVFTLWGQPVKLLIMAGALNGMILPFSLAIMLWVAAKSKNITGMPSAWLIYAGWVVVALMLWMSMPTLWRSLTAIRNA